MGASITRSAKPINKKCVFTANFLSSLRVARGPLVSTQAKWDKIRRSLGNEYANRNHLQLPRFAPSCRPFCSFSCDVLAQLLASEQTLTSRAGCSHLPWSTSATFSIAAIAFELWGV